jgi:hypothetical protein
MRVSRYALTIVLCATSAGALEIWSAAANAGDTSKPEAAGTQGNGTESKSAPGRVPKDIIIVNPCRTAHPPSYCNVKN